MVSDFDLDDEQQMVVDAPDRAIAVYAGPGSGKTRTLIYRTAKLLKDDTTASALLLTFTNKAAAELKSRAIKLIPVAAERISAFNFHSFGHQLLRVHGSLVGISDDFEILDDDEQHAIAHSVLISNVVPDVLGNWRRDRLRLRPSEAQTAAFGQHFEAEKRSRNVVDFDDLVVYPQRILRDFPAVARAYGERFAHLLVDEFQDTNPCQLAIIELLARHGRSVAVFADDDQAIFAFQHADTANLKAFVDHLGAKRLALSTNYRSGENIVNAAAALIGCDPRATGRRMRSHRIGGTIAVVAEADADAEAAAIADQIEHRIGSGTDPTKIAVLSRNARRSDQVVGELIARQIPVTDWRGDTFGREERKAIAASLAVVRATLRDSHAHRLAGYIGVETPHTRDVEQFLDTCGDHPLVHALLGVRALAFSGGLPADIVRDAAAGLSGAVPELGDGLEEICRQVRLFQDADPGFSLDHLLAELAVGATGRGPESGGGIRIATIHRTKGLEWASVFLVGIEQGTLPDFRAHADDQVSEERRLCFVGVCRAQNDLTISYASTLYGYPKVPSQFIAEMSLDF